MPLDELVFFVDRSLGGKYVAEALRAEGLTVEIHDKHFPIDAPDEMWLLARTRAAPFVAGVTRYGIRVYPRSTA